MNYSAPEDGLYIYNGIIRVGNDSASYPVMMADVDVLNIVGPDGGHYYCLDIETNQLMSAALGPNSAFPLLEYVVLRYDINLNAEDLVIMPSLTKDDIIGRIG